MLTNWEFSEAKKNKIEEVAYIASEIIALSILEDYNYSAAENKEKERFFLVRDNAGFGDKRKWCMKFIEKNTGVSKIFYLAEKKEPHKWVSTTMEEVPKLLDSLKAKIISE